MKGLKTIIKCALNSKDANRMVSLRERLEKQSQQQDKPLSKDTISQ